MAAGKRFHDGLMATSDSMKKVFLDIFCVILYCQTVRYVRQSLTYLGLLDIDAAVLIKRTAYFKSKLAILYLLFYGFVDYWFIFQVRKAYCTDATRPRCPRKICC